MKLKKKYPKRIDLLHTFNAAMLEVFIFEADSYAVSKRLVKLISNNYRRRRKGKS